VNIVATVVVALICGAGRRDAIAAVGEDRRRSRRGAAAEDAAIRRRIALAVSRLHPRTGHSIKPRRSAAGWNNAYRLQLLSGL